MLQKTLFHHVAYVLANLRLNKNMEDLSLLHQEKFDFLKGFF